MTTQPLGYDVVFDENGRPQFSDDAAAQIRSRLGHDPLPGETLRLVDPLNGADEILPEVSESMLDHFLREVAVNTFEEMDAHPEHRLTTDQVRANLAARHAMRTAAK